MEIQYENTVPIERDPARRSVTSEQQNWLARGSIFDPAYDRANAALRRWIDGMEAALSDRQTR